MSRRLELALAAGLALCCVSGWESTAAGVDVPSLGQAVAPADLANYFSIPPSGDGLPPGRGTAAQGRKTYATTCVACHGDKLQGVSATGGLPLIGGRGTLATSKPLKTVESYWPYATTLFDYTKRAMPFNAPGSLTDDQVYAVVAYILAEGHVIAATDVMDAKSVAAVRMPNAGGFTSDPRPPDPPGLRLPK